MGQHYSHPKPGVKPLVICAGLPRTGTASICAALEILLNGPVYHGGTQIFLGQPWEIQTATRLVNQWPASDDDPIRRDDQLALLDRLVGRGYVAVADSPGAGLVPELQALYPDAKVVVTTRDVERWEASMRTVSSASTMWFLRVVLFPLPTMRHFVPYINALRRQWLVLYGETEPPTRKTYYRHIDWMREVVPEDKLFFVDVKDGWGPLCEALGVPVPEDIEFPNINDGKSIEDFAARQVGKGVVAWLKILALGGLTMGAGWLARG